MDIRGKRLLILGGQQKLCDIVTRAKELGVYCIVTDWYENSPAKKIADKSFQISTSDVDAILELIKAEKIDGVLTGYIDSTLPYYCEICKKANLPCYLNESVLHVCTNKRNFKDACKAVGIKTIREVDINKPKSFEFPILIKPVDNSGSKGITVCSDETMVRPAYERALRFSKSKSVIIEKFMDCDYVCAHYIVTDGKAELAMLMDKDMNRIGRGTVPYPTAFVSPSKYYESFLETEHPLIQEFVRSIGYNNGTFLISFFVNGNNYYAIELSARLTATREYIFINDSLGIDTLEMYIRHSLTGVFACDKEIYRGREACYCMLFTFLNNGIIGKIEGMDSVLAMSGVLDVLQLRDVGATIRADGSYGQLFSRIHLKAEEAAEMRELINEVEDSIQVYSEEGKPMVIAGFDADRFFSWYKYRGNKTAQLL